MALKKPQAAIVVIGTELTLGRSRESNSEFLGRWLSRHGYDVRLALKLPDEIETITDEIMHLVDVVDILLLTGGLGATHDDLTREALARVTGGSLVLNGPLEAAIKSLAPAGIDSGRFMRQACLFEGARSIGPFTGTAPGLIVDYRGKVIYALPGVPGEMKSMLDDVAVDLDRRFGRLNEMVMRTVVATGAPEPVIASIIEPVIVDYPQIQVNILAKPEIISITLIADERANELLSEAVRRLKEELGDFFVGVDEETMSAVIGRLLNERRLTLSVAESITAGQIGALIAQNSGSSSYFAGGILAYGNDIKERLLGISPEILATKGAVSPETALEMAHGARKALNTDIGLSVTGIAGPTGATATKPVGLVYVGLAAREHQEVKELRLRGVRQLIQERAALRALDLLRLYLQQLRPL